MIQISDGFLRHWKEFRLFPMGQGKPLKSFRLWENYQICILEGSLVAAWRIDWGRGPQSGRPERRLLEKDQIKGDKGPSEGYSIWNEIMEWLEELLKGRICRTLWPIGMVWKRHSQDDFRVSGQTSENVVVSAQEIKYAEKDLLLLPVFSLGLTL